MMAQTACPGMVMERLVYQYGTSMLRTCCCYLRDESAAQDAVQDSFVKICRAYPGFEDPTREKAWVMRVTVNTCRDALRSPWLRRVTLVDQYPSVPADPDTPEECGRLFSEIQKLRPKLREVVLLRYYHDFSVKEIAKMLHLSPSAVSMRLTRAGKILQTALDGIPWEEC